MAACDKPRGGGKQPLIRGFPNGETPPQELRRPTSEYIGCVEGTWGSETSQYPEEKKKSIRRLYKFALGISVLVRTEMREFIKSAIFPE